MIEFQRLLETVDRAYWENELEVYVEDSLRRAFADRAALERWVGDLAMLQFSHVAERMGFDADVKREDLVAAVEARATEVAPLVLAETFVYGKRDDAIWDVARSRLTLDQLEPCMKTPSQIDRIAMVWKLWDIAPEGLKIVLLLTTMLRRGFARLVMAHKAPATPEATEHFFQAANLQRILDGCSKWTGPKRHICAGVLCESDGRRLIFIKKALKAGFVAVGETNHHGYEREWVVIDFYPSMESASVSSATPDAGCALANELASSYFGKRVVFEPANQLTSIEKVTEFLRKLMKEPTLMPMVALQLRSAPLDGGPALQLLNPKNTPIVTAIQELSAKTRDVFEDPHDVDFVKLHLFGKRVKVSFDPLGPKVFAVRYEDQKLRPRERRQFEQMIFEHFGIHILSSEKKRAA